MLGHGAHAERLGGVVSCVDDEQTGIIGGNEPETPIYWRYSIEIAQAWERAQQEATAPQTRKVAMRAAMVTSGRAPGYRMKSGGRAITCVSR